MNETVAAEIARLESMSVSQLSERFEEVFGEECRSRHKRYLVRRIAWRLQANAEGGLAVSPDPSSATTARIADLHERIARAELQASDVKNRTAEIEQQRVDETDVAAAFADFDNVWNALSTREQTQVLALLVARVEFDPADSTIAISFYPSAIKALADGNIEDAA